MNSALDYQNSPSDESIMPTVIRYGLIGGGILIVLQLVMTLSGFSDPANAMETGNMMTSIGVGLLSFIAYVVIQVIGVRHYKQNISSGFISFGKAFGIAILIAIIMAVIGSLFNYIYMTFINPGFLETVLDATRDMYEEMGMGEDEIDQAMKIVKMTMNPVAQIIAGLFSGAIMGGISGLIIAAVMKKDPPLA